MKTSELETLNKKLLVAVNKSNTTEIKELLRKGADPNSSFQFSEPVGAGSNSVRRKCILSIAAEFGDVEIVKLLIENGADVNAKENYRENSGYGSDDYEITLLNRVISYGNLIMVKLFLDNGADVNAKDDYYGTSLSCATSFGNNEVIELIKNYNTKK